MFKKCTVCKITKNYDDYYIRPSGVPYSQCNSCKKKSSKKWYDENSKNKDKYDVEGKICPECKIYKSKTDYYVLKNNGQMLTYCKECELKKYNNNLQSRKLTKQKWRENNKDHIKKSQLEYHHTKRKYNIQYRLTQSLRSEMHRVLNKNDKTTNLIGCSIENFKTWIQFQFNKCMNWDNYGTYWEIDHTIPCNNFDLELKEEQLKCFNWENLRPLEVSLNRSKRDKILKNDIFKQKLNVINFKKQHVQIAGTS